MPPAADARRAAPDRPVAGAPRGRARADGPPTDTSATTLQRDAAERVLRRAVELADGDGEGDPATGGVSVRALLEAADELDIDPSGVLRAVAEEQLGLLRHDHPRTDRLLGPEVVVASRLVEGTPAEVLDRSDAWLRRDALRRTRSQSDWAEYRRRTDPVASVQRAARNVRGDRQLERVQRVRVVTAAVDGHRTLVALVVDVHTSRTVALAGGGTAAATGAAAALANVVTWPAWMWLTVPASAAAGLGIVAARRSWVDRVDDELESLLDRVAGADVPGSVLDGLTDRVLGGRRVRRG